MIVSDRSNSGAQTAQISLPADNEKLEMTIKVYQALRNRVFRYNIEGEVTIFDADGSHREKLQLLLGDGGSKKAIKIANGRALLLPNLDVDSLDSVISRWRRMVQEETTMGQVLARIGLLGVRHQKVEVAVDEFPQEKLPAYVCESFASLIDKGWFIIDGKNSNSSTWQLGKSFLFDTLEKKITPENWYPIIDSLVSDVAKLMVYDLPMNYDCMNLAVVKKGTKKAEYELRYYGFDFSSKYIYMTVPSLEKRDIFEKDPKRTFHSLIELIFWYEFIGHRQPEGLSTKLVEYCMQAFPKEVEAIMSQKISD